MAMVWAISLRSDARAITAYWELSGELVDPLSEIGGNCRATNYGTQEGETIG